ncbi:MAG TPA: Phenylacetic acid catabolic protein [Candidatus Binataceae bacterium]|jgi:1,2-phenylacetyl-CoA epoxidase catalytic subunit|nr:Phenylacetic acid catabolic protein [Candidatus Binataceae bacterium]
MAVGVQFGPRRFEAADLVQGRVEPYYTKVLVRLLGAHALAEKLTAEGYRRAAATVTDPEIRRIADKNLAEELKHAALIYDLLAELGVSEQSADRASIPLRRAPSFQAPRYFAEQAEGEMGLLMGNISLDMTGLIMIGVNYRDSSYAPHARAAELILEEEADHDEFGTLALRIAVQRLGADAVGVALLQWLPWAVNFFGPPGSGFTFDCLRYGLKHQDNDELAGLFLSMLERRLTHLGLEMPPLSKTYPHVIV